MDYLTQALPALLSGAKLTVGLFAITLALSIPLGLSVALIRRSSNKIIIFFIDIYIWLMRGTPLMLQLFFFYYALPTIDIILPPFTTAIVAFVLNYTAYFSEIFRSGIQSIDKGQHEAAKALGLTPNQTLRRVVLPQMWKRIIPPIHNETLALVKDTSLIYVLALQDIMRIIIQMVNKQFSTMPFLIAAVFYLIMALIMTWFFKKLEKYYARYDG